MNIFQAYSLRSLKKNKTRTIVTIIGIILSVAMITAISTIISSITDYGKRYEISKSGNYFVVISNANSQTHNEILNRKETKRVMSAIYEGYALSNSTNEYKPYYCVQAVTDTFFDNMPIQLIEGSLPTNSSEILLPIHYTNYSDDDYKIGDTITMELTYRTSTKGTHLGQHASLEDYESGEPLKEDLTIIATREYTIVGFMERPNFEEYTAPGFTCLTYYDENSISQLTTTNNSSDNLNTNNNSNIYNNTNNNNIIDNSDTFADEYILLTNAKYAIPFCEDYANDYFAFTHTSLLRYYGISSNSAFNAVLYGMGGILLFIVIVGSITLIHNAFVISINERTKEFGLLASVGATKKQMKHTIFFESFVLCALSIPLGIISGIVGIGITLNFISEPIERMMFGNSSARLTLHISPSAILVATIISIITVLISAYIPMKRTLKMSIIDSIKQRKDIRLTSKNVKTPKLINKLFKIEGVLAYKHYKRNKRNYKTIIVSLSLSIVLFISAGAFSEYTFSSYDDNTVTNKYDFLLYVYSYSDFTQIVDMVNKENSIKQSETYLTTMGSYALCELDKEYSCNFGYDCEIGLTDIYQSFVSDNVYSHLLKEYNLDKQIGNADYSTLTDAILFNSCTEYDIETDYDVLKPIIVSDTNTLTLINDYDARIYEYLTDEERIQYAYDFDSNSNGTYNYTDFRDVYDDFDNLDTTTISILGTLTPKSGVEPPVSNLGFVLPNTSSRTPFLIYPMSAYDNVINSLEFCKDYNIAYSSMYIILKSSSYEDTLTFINELSDSYDIYYTDYVQAEAEYRSTKVMLNVLTYGFICLISLICIANIFNTISTSMNLRKREFAMLKSYGLSDKQFSKMLNFECLIYSCKGSLYGIIASFFICILLYRVGFETLEGFYAPISLFVIAIVFTILIIYISIMYSKIHQSKDNVVETLQKESI